MNRLLILLLAVLHACAWEGNRARTMLDGGSSCPAGETCSPDTPTGLIFRSPEQYPSPCFFCSRGPIAVAVNGTETISFVRADTSQPVMGYTATADGAIALATTHPDAGQTSFNMTSAVVVRGESSGAGLLRIVSASTGLLFDSTTVNAVVVDNIGVATNSERSLASIAADVLLLSGGAVDLWFTYHSGSTLAVDETAVVSWSGDSAITASNATWHAITLHSARAGVGVVNSRTSTASRSVSVTTIDHIDAIQSIPTEGDSLARDPSMPMESYGTLCFAATAGGVQVFGANWSFSAPPGITATLSFFGVNCTTVGAAAGTTGVLHVDASGVGADVPIRFM